MTATVASDARTAALTRSLVVLPAVVAAVGLTAHAAIALAGSGSIAGGAGWLPWAVAGFATGHSLSGSI